MNKEDNLFQVLKLLSDKNQTLDFKFQTLMKFSIDKLPEYNPTDNNLENIKNFYSKWLKFEPNDTFLEEERKVIKNQVVYLIQELKSKDLRVILIENAEKDFKILQQHLFDITKLDTKKFYKENEILIQKYKNEMKISTIGNSNFLETQISIIKLYFLLKVDRLEEIIKLKGIIKENFPNDPYNNPIFGLFNDASLLHLICLYGNEKFMPVIENDIFYCSKDNLGLTPFNYLNYCPNENFKKKYQTKIKGLAEKNISYIRKDLTYILINRVKNTKVESLNTSKKKIGDYYEIKEIGKGSYGKVYHVSKNPNENQKIFAMKVIPIEKTTKNEIEILKFLSKYSHTNLLKIYEINYYEEYISILMPYYELNLESYLNFKKQNSTSQKYWLTNQEIQNILSQIIDGLEYLHNNNIIHRDIKSSNILISLKNGGEPKIIITDFGLSRDYSQKLSMTSGNVGTELYMAPEILKSNHYDSSVDIFSFGCLILIDFFKFGDDSPIRENIRFKEYTVINKIKDKYIKLGVDPKFFKISDRCLKIEPEERIKIFEIKQLLK